MVFVDKNPEKTKSAEPPGDDGADKAKQGLRPTDVFTIESLDF